MKKKWIHPLIVLLIAMTIASCSKKEATPVQANTILIQATKAALEKAADSVFMTVNTPGMIALISVEGEGDYLVKRGVSNIVTDEPMNVDNYFRIGSITKTFVGTAILILVDEGKIKLDSSISHYLPECNVPNGDHITIRNLGTMSSGLFDYTHDSLWLDDLYQSNFLMPFTPQSLLAYAFRHPSDTTMPGIKYDYCNTNLILLGLLMEKVTGKTVEEVVEEKVVIPMNLKHTFWPNSIFLFSPYTHGYYFVNDKFQDASNWNPSWCGAAGIMVSTIPDLKQWVKALAEGKFLSDDMKAERLKLVGGIYGFCLMKHGDWVGHTGSIYGYNTIALFNTAKRITLLINVTTNFLLPVGAYGAAFQKILDP